MVVEAKRKLVEQGVNQELLDLAIKEYINEGNKLANENIRLKLENEALDVELIDLKHEIKSFTDSIEVTFEKIVSVDLENTESIENFKKMQHEASRKLNIIKLLKRIL